MYHLLCNALVHVIYARVSSQCSHTIYRNHPVRQSVCLSVHISSNRNSSLAVTDETLHSCIVQPEDMHEGG